MHGAPALAPAALQVAFFLAYGVAQALLVLSCVHRYAVLWRWWRSWKRVAEPASGGPLPVVTVQLPIFNEPAVAERLLEAVAALEYPRDRLEIQVLDDSTDDTSAVVARVVGRLRARGLEVVHVRRPSRQGYKAGALAAGLERARGELIAVLDADFLPRPDFLARMVGRFDDPQVGMVQARWTHLNRDRSDLTVAQAVLLDAHFLVEHRSRATSGLFFNFNGTAGVWRKACLEDAGGWSADTLTEDLDVSYRAQLRGWRFRFEPGVEVPGELPADIEALKSQQRRWAKGSIQTARKLLPAILGAELSLRVKLESAWHLTANAGHPLLLALGLLLFPVLLGPGRAEPWLAWSAQAAVLLFGVLPVVLFLVAGQRAAGQRWGRTAGGVAAALLLAVGLSLSNARAVLEGLGRRTGPWERTPKTGDRGGRRPPPASRRPGGGAGETALAISFAVLAAWAWRGGESHAVPFALLLALGFGRVALASVRAG